MVEFAIALALSQSLKDNIDSLKENIILTEKLIKCEKDNENIIQNYKFKIKQAEEKIKVHKLKIKKFNAIFEDVKKFAKGEYSPEYTIEFNNPASY